MKAMVRPDGDRTPPRRFWSSGAQGAAIAALLVAVAFVYLRAHGAVESNPESGGGVAGSTTPPTGRAGPAGTFQVTPAQLASLNIAPAARQLFRSEQVTDGRIALNANQLTPVYSPFSGRVLRVLAGPGDRVEKGAPLLAIEASEFVQAQGDLLAASTAVISARSQLGLARVTEQRKHALYDAKGGSQQDWEQSQNDLVAAESTLRTAEGALGLVRNRLRILGKTDAEIDSLASAGQMDPVAYVVAPISGVVTDRQVGTGQYVQASSGTPVFTVGNLGTVWLVANVRESAAATLHLGEEVEVRVPAFPDRVFKARLTFIASSVDPLTHRLAVRAEIGNPEGVLKPEMFANFTIATSAESPSLAVPERAVVYEGDAAHVWVSVSPGSLVYRPIRTGRTVHGFVEVLAGLETGEGIVTSGALFIDRAATSE